MKKKIILITIALILLGGLFFGVYKFLQNFKEDQELTKETMDKILSSYEEFSKDIEAFASKREEFYNLLENTYLEDFAENYTAWNDYIVEYENVLKDVEDNSDILKEYCFMKFSSVDVNSACTNFKANYEAAHNYYITDINSYNETVSKYNVWAKSNGNDYGLLNEGNLPIYKDYIDFDKDGEYFGKEDLND